MTRSSRKDKRRVLRRAQGDEQGRRLSPDQAAREWIEKTAAQFPR